MRTIIGDPHAPQRNPDRQGAETRRTLKKAKRAVTSKSGKALLRKRGEHLERSFCHVLDQGGMRRATLRGCEKLTMRLIGSVIAFNLSLLMRHLHGVGTPKQWEARAMGAAFWVLQCLTEGFTGFRVRLNGLSALRRHLSAIAGHSLSSAWKPCPGFPAGYSSTGC